MPAPKKKQPAKPSPALQRAAKNLGKGSGDAGLALEERLRIKQLEAEKAKKNKGRQTNPPSSPKKTNKRK